MRTIRIPSLAALCLACADALAVQSVTLPAWVCAHPDAIFVSGMEPSVPVPSDPSNGSGGAYPGFISRTLHIANLGTGTQTYYLYLPSDYTPTRPWPFLLALHGTAPDGSQDTWATDVRSAWAQVAATGHFIVATPVANEVSYYPGYGYIVSWLVPPTSGPNDYDLFAAVRADVESAYNIERTRIYGWGFSSGGSVMHDLGINTYSNAFNASTMAAYSVSAGSLAGLACTNMTDDQCNQVLAGIARKIPVDLHVGTSDSNYQTVLNDDARFQQQGWNNGVTLYFNPFNGGHDYYVPDLQIAWTNLCPNAVVP